MQKSLYTTWLVIGTVIIIALLSFAVYNNSQIQELNKRIDALQKTPVINKELLSDKTNSLMQDCLKTTKLDAECKAVLNSDSSFCSSAVDPEECRGLLKTVRVIQKRSSDCLTDDPVLQAVCNALAANDQKVCESAGDAKTLCLALLSSDSKLCEVYPDSYLKGRCHSLLTWFSAIKTNDIALCNRVSYVSDMLACRASLSDKKEICADGINEVCLLVAKQKTGE